jgi:hypothetical protein
MVQINRTRIVQWIDSLKPYHGYKGYTWRVLSKNQVKEFWVYTFIYYDRNGEQYQMKRISTDINDRTTVNDLAKAIIDFDGGIQCY